jgi:MoaA/NifB/PqqE/SkfB family radical SAM enzyme
MSYLKHIEINIWKACNNKCRFCMSSKSQLWDIKFVSLDNLKEKIILYSDKLYNSVWFLWWDISIHPNIAEIISFCKKVWFKHINIISNWMKFDDFELSKKIVNLWLTRINISIHSHLSEIEDYLTQVPWWLNRKLKAIDNFNILFNKWLLRDNLSINIVINKLNYKTIIDSILYFAFKKWIKDIRLNFIWLEDSVKENWDELTLSYSDFLPYLKKIIYISIKYNIRITFDTIPACIFYNIDNKNFKSIIKKFLWEDKDYITEIDHINANINFDWKKRKKDILKTQFKQCKKCIYQDSCEWVRKEYWELYWGEEFKAIN